MHILSPVTDNCPSWKSGRRNESMLPVRVSNPWPLTYESGALQLRYAARQEIKVKGQRLGAVTSFKYLRAFVSHHGLKPEWKSRIEQATAAPTKSMPIWRDNNISVRLKVKPKHSLVIFIYSVCLWIRDLYSRAWEFGMLWKATKHFIPNLDHKPLKRFAERFKQPLKNMVNSWPCLKKWKLRMF